MKLLIFAIVWALATLIAVVAFAETRVRDGDTIVLHDTPIRLKGLSCAENKTDLGKSQTAYLKQWMSTTTQITCNLTGEKTYDREVGYCFFDDVDVGRAMITNAYCEPCRRYDEAGRYDDLPVRGDVPDYCRER